jgi:hypothetical protein
MEIIRNKINDYKPKLSEKSVKAYVSTLINLYESNNGADAELDINWFDNYDIIEPIIKKLNTTKAKNTITACLSLQSNEQYSQLLKELSGRQTNELKTQEKKPQEDKNWLTQEQIKAKYETDLKEIIPLIKLKELTKKQYKQFQDFIILALVSGYHIPPRRSMDWTEFKIRNISKKDDNYMDKNIFVFNTFKGSNSYIKKKDPQYVEIPDELHRLLKAFIKFNKSDYLLNDSRGNKLTSVKLNQHLHKILELNASVNIMRHSYVSEKFPVNIKNLEQAALDMGTSSNQILNTYVKI